MCNILQVFVPSSCHPGVVPLKCWTGRKQDVSHLHPFGCVTYAQVLVGLVASKLDPQSVKYVLIGYYGHGAYKLFDSVTGAVIKAQNVIFEEGQSHLTLPQPLVDFFPEPTCDTPPPALSDPHHISHAGWPVMP